MRELSARTANLAYEQHGVPAGTIFVMGAHGGVSADPEPGAVVTFGRNVTEVDVCIGAGDERVSRRHGVVERVGQRWVLRNVGRLPIRLPASRMLFPDDGPVELDTGYTPLFIRSRSGREHVVEVRVAGPPGAHQQSYDGSTSAEPIWHLSAEEKLVMIVLGQRYLRHDAHPQPLSWRQVADELNDIVPEQGWTSKRAEHVGVAVRKRLSLAGVAGLTRDEVGDPRRQRAQPQPAARARLGGRSRAAGPARPTDGEH